MIVERPQPFYLNELNYELLFFDIFFKGNKIHLISPIYNEPYDDNDIRITYNDHPLSINEKIIKNEYEPISIFKYDIDAKNDIIDIIVEFNNIKKKFNLTQIKEEKKYLTLSTLFLNDYKLINIFYEYYVAQGVQHFYFYYNGKLNENILNEFNEDNITLIEWPYQYWNHQKYKYVHHAQMGSLNHALYKYGKDFSEYMIFNDLDEYFHIPNKTLFKSLEENNYDLMQFCNRWSTTLDDKIPNKFPLKFKTSPQQEYKKRSKNIYRCDIVEKIGIHFCSYFNKEDLKILEKLDMYHFYNWSQTNRNLETITL